jgi:hypothetical protein
MLFEEGMFYLSIFLQTRFNLKVWNHKKVCYIGEYAFLGTCLILDSESTIPYSGLLKLRDGVAGKPVQMIYLSIYATNPFIVKGISMYCGSKNAERCSAVPVGEYICVRYTYESRVDQTHFKLMSKAENQTHLTRGSRKTR